MIRNESIVEDTGQTFAQSENINNNAKKETYYKNKNKKIKALNKSVVDTKVFLNMVIHDLRNPTN